ncbi:hypothetical protein [Nocardia sp. NPDC050406]|uniref:LppU family putative lipoprotein n=1 Tax=Nocardia sp. NPDC050406 TaxID=3364318 RepID=UPI0037B8B805
MSSRRFQAGLILTAVVIGGAVAVAGVLAAALSLPGLTSGDTAPTTGAAPVSMPAMTFEASPLALADPAVPGRTALTNKTAAQGRPAVNVGDCVDVGNDAPLAKTACGTGESGYRIVQTAAEHGHCPADVDHIHHEPRLGADNDAVCLDIDWVVGGCMRLGDDPTHIDCHTPADTQAVRVLAIERDTTDITRCPSGDAGFVYDQRRIVVCVAHLP